VDNHRTRADHLPQPFNIILNGLPRQVPPQEFLQLSADIHEVLIEAHPLIS
jgi:hypothetical protein